MAGGYQVPREGLQGLAAKFTDLQRQINELRGTANAQSTIVGKGGITIKDAGTLTVVGNTPGSDVHIDQYGLQFRPGGPYYDGGLGVTDNQMQLSPPHGEGFETYETYVFMRGPDTVDPTGLIALITGGIIRLAAPVVTLPSLPEVGSPDYTLGYDSNGTDWSMCLITSAAKYKQDIAPADVDPAAVLAIEPVTFRDKASVEKNPDAKTNFGVIADQLHDLGLGHLLVTYGADGEPDAVKYDRIGVALLPVVKAQQSQIDALTARLDALEAS